MITYNNGPTIEKALASVAGWAAEVVVVDSESTDGASEIIGRYTDRLYQLCTTDMAEKYGYAQSLCTHPWVLFVDADEWLTPEIKGEIEEVLRAGPATTGSWCGGRIFTWAGSSGTAGGIPTTRSGSTGRNAAAGQGASTRKCTSRAG